MANRNGRAPGWTSDSTGRVRETLTGWLANPAIRVSRGASAAIIS
jgi:hypothetical protein